MPARFWNIFRMDNWGPMPAVRLGIETARMNLTKYQRTRRRKQYEQVTRNVSAMKRTRRL